jgi:hypothetical protein
MGVHINGPQVPINMLNLELENYERKEKQAAPLYREVLLFTVTSSTETVKTPNGNKQLIRNQ